MVQELSAAIAIERVKFNRVNRCLRSAVARFVLWVIVILTTVGS